MKTFGEIVFGGNIQLSRPVLFNVNDGAISAVLRFLFKFGEMGETNLVQPGQGNTGVTERCNPIFGQNVLTFSGI
jgi:hypothetical protein